MTTVNLADTNLIGSASMPNGDFLTFDALIKNKFTLLIPSLPNVQFFLQSFDMPSVSLDSCIVDTRFVDYSLMGDKLIYEPITLTFLVDKYVRNYSNVFNWMKSMTVEGSNVGFTDNVVLMVDNQPLIRFNDAYPVSISGLNMDSTVTGVEYIKCSLTMRYSYFDYIGQFSTSDSSY